MHTTSNDKNNWIGVDISKKELEIHTSLSSDALDITYALTQVQASKAGTQVDFNLNADNLFTGLQLGYTWKGYSTPP